jgi:hypothetical protein
MNGPNPEPMGRPFGFGYTICHGCEREFRGELSGVHDPDCPGVCTRRVCEWHKPEQTVASR